MNFLLEAFVLGNSAILTNVCMLPLYPGLIAFLAGTNAGGKSRPSAWLGVLVLAGVLTMMLLIGAVFSVARQSIASVLPVLLPAIYGLVVVLGILMLLGLNPFARLATSQSPVLRDPRATAFLYGALLAPMTLPCIGPLIIATFALGAGSAGTLAQGLLYFLAFGLGFGWPLVALPLLAAPLQRRFTKWLSARYTLIGRISGALLVVIGLVGLYSEFAR